MTAYILLTEHQTCNWKKNRLNRKIYICIFISYSIFFFDDFQDIWKIQRRDYLVFVWRNKNDASFCVEKLLLNFIRMMKKLTNEYKRTQYGTWKAQGVVECRISLLRSKIWWNDFQKELNFHQLNRIQYKFILWTILSFYFWVQNFAWIADRRTRDVYFKGSPLDFCWNKCRIDYIWFEIQDLYISKVLLSIGIKKCWAGEHSSGEWYFILHCILIQSQV